MAGTAVTEHICLALVLQRRAISDAKCGTLMWGRSAKTDMQKITTSWEKIFPGQKDAAGRIECEEALKALQREKKMTDTRLDRNRLLNKMQKESEQSKSSKHNIAVRQDNPSSNAAEKGEKWIKHFCSCSLLLD